MRKAKNKTPLTWKYFYNEAFHNKRMAHDFSKQPGKPILISK